MKLVSLALFFAFNSLVNGSMNDVTGVDTSVPSDDTSNVPSGVPFVDNCEFLGYDYSSILVRCNDGDISRLSRLDLNACLANHDGKLAEWDPSKDYRGFRDSCTKYAYSYNGKGSPMLGALCKGIQYSYNQNLSTFDLRTTSEKSGFLQSEGGLIQCRNGQVKSIEIDALPSTFISESKMPRPEIEVVNPAVLDSEVTDEDSDEAADDIDLWGGLSGEDFLPDLDLRW
ncbi:hypothetical protein BJ508DRAFT_312065 [Ascobolus immersus RN42]|uniref:Cyanovirin-N domain-containing protein n=1 Tax=Ascobolus immersus RN42 TaxID=1160509 RepID=A0A3N4HQX6_ASCIM|nr:hypothetical protein BJ508DRAFT_312065 [Ascobolus immersus RN42]